MTHTARRGGRIGKASIPRPNSGVRFRRRNDATGSFTGYRGFELAVGDKPLMVTRLGRYKLAGNTELHQVIVMRKAEGVRDASDKPSEVVATAMIDASKAAAADGYNYTILEKPVIFEKGLTYYVASFEEYSSATGDTFAVGGSVGSAVLSELWGSTQCPTAGVAMDPTSGVWAVADMDQTPDEEGYVYAELATPVRLEAGEEYLLVSREYEISETANDVYYYGRYSDDDLPVLTYDPNLGIQVIGAGYFMIDARTWYQITGQGAIDPGSEGLLDRCFGPLNMKLK
jgi:hypothetical protein